MIEAIQVLAALGIMLSLTYIYRLMNFVWIYCFRPSSVHKYLHGTNPYAIVTGASDGIGKALAIELYDKGFSLILHGRNEEKTKHVVDEIRARARDGRDVRYFITDTGDLEQDFQKIVQGFRGSNITLVVHNAGGSPRKSGRLETWTENEVLSVIHLNAIFPLLFTRALLPQLRAAQGPTLVIFVGSISADIPMARFGIYASSKNFLEALARCLDADELWPAPTSGPSFMYLAVGNVVTNSTRTIPHLFNPTSERFAKAVVARIGCGRRRITPYMPHAIQQWCVTMIGESSVQRIIARELSNLLQENKKSE